jgi:hypothetical protein
MGGSLAVESVDEAPLAGEKPVFQGPGSGFAEVPIGADVGSIRGAVNRATFNSI